MLNFAFDAFSRHAKSKYIFRPKRRAPKHDADWCDRFVQNSHGEPIGDKSESCREMPFCEVCNFACGQLRNMPPTKYKNAKYKK